MYTEAKSKLNTFIIQISNTIKCILLFLYKLEHISNSITLNYMLFIMHNREITHIVKTDGYSKNSIGKVLVLFLMQSKSDYKSVKFSLRVSVFPTNS